MSDVPCIFAIDPQLTLVGSRSALLPRALSCRSVTITSKSTLQAMHGSVS